MIGYGGFSGVHIPIWVTKEFGLLEKHQLKGDLVMIPGSARQMQGLISGSIQFSCQIRADSHSIFAYRFDRSDHCHTTGRRVGYHCGRTQQVPV